MLFGLVNKNAVVPYKIVDGVQSTTSDPFFNTPYTYDPALADFGCSAIHTPCIADNIQNIGFPNWLATSNSAVDLRGFFASCDTTTGLYKLDF